MTVKFGTTQTLSLEAAPYARNKQSAVCESKKDPLSRGVSVPITVPVDESMIEKAGRSGRI